MRVLKLQFGILTKGKDCDKLTRKKDKQKAKEDEKLEKRRQKEEKLKKHAEKEREREKKKQEKIKQTKGPGGTGGAGVSLTGQSQLSLIEDFAQSETNRIPLFLEKCVRFIEEEGLDSEGIYRVPGNRAHVELLFQKFEEGNFFIFIFFI